jgi:hypothetical protein
VTDLFDALEPSTSSVHADWPEITRELERRRRLEPRRSPTGRLIEWTEAPNGLANIGVRYDGSLINPNGYPEEEVRAVLEAHFKTEREQRDAIIAKGVRTRARRRLDRLWQAVKAWKAGTLSPANKSRCCKKHLTDPVSKARGIGPECWEEILLWENKTERELAAKGVDRIELLTEIAGLRTWLTEHAEELRTRAMAEREKRHQENLALARERGLSSYESPKTERLRYYRNCAESDQDRRLRLLAQIEDQLGRGAFDDHDRVELSKIEALIA